MQSLLIIFALYSYLLPPNFLGFTCSFLTHIFVVIVLFLEEAILKHVSWSPVS